MKTTLLPWILLGSLLAGGCSSVRYADATDEETLTIDYGLTDLQRLAGHMAESMTQSPALAYLDNSGKTNDMRIIVYMGGIENRTSEHIDTTGIADKVQTQLLQTGRFRFVATQAGQAEIGEQVRFQQSSGRVREDMQREFGRQLGADVIVYGTLRSIDKKKGSSLESGGVRKEDLYFQFVLKCVNIDTAEIIWIDEKELRKQGRTGLFGR